MALKVFRAVRELCDGCRMCELVCSAKKSGKVNPHLARIKITRSEKEDHPFPVICRHCKNPPCQQACPIPQAMYREQRTGVVIINEAECISCLACVDACPFGAIQVGPHREILKCDLCGGEPVCVRYCPPRPEHSLPHLPWPKQSCLQYIEPHKITRNKRMSRGERE
jgi:Fe-S-cluster-containing hydrogenase component 2